MNKYKIVVAVIVGFLFESNLFSSEIENIENQLKSMQQIVITYVGKNVNQKWNDRDIEALQQNMSTLYTDLRNIRKETQIGRDLSQLFLESEAEARFVNNFLQENEFNAAGIAIKDLFDKLSELRKAIQERIPLAYFQFQDAEGVTYGLRENSLLWQKTPFLINISKYQKENEERDGTKENPFLLVGVDSTVLDTLNLLVNGTLKLNEISDETLVDIAILVDYLQLQNSENEELSTFVDQLKDRLLEELRDIDLFDTQDIEGLQRLAEIFGGEIKEKIDTAIPPVYFQIGEHLYGLRKDHLLLQTDFFDKIKRQAEAGSIEDPLVLEDIDAYYFEEFVRKIQDPGYDLFEFVDFEANIDLYSHLLLMIDRFLLLDDERFDQFIFDFATVLKNNQDNLELLNEQMYEFALQIIEYEEEKNDYMIQIGGIKTGKIFNLGNFQVFAKTLTGKTITLDAKDLSLPIYLIDGQEYVDREGVEDWIRKAGVKIGALTKDQDFIVIVSGKIFFPQRELSIERLNDRRLLETIHLTTPRK